MRGSPEVRLLQERLGGKADALDLTRALGDIAALKQALGPAYLTTQGTQPSLCHHVWLEQLSLPALIHESVRHPEHTEWQLVVSAPAVSQASGQVSQRQHLHLPL